MNTSSTSSFSSSSPYSSSSPSSSASSIQLGGKGYRRKKGGENENTDSYSDLEITENPLTESMGTQKYDTVGGKRRRKSRKSRKSRKLRKSRKTKRRRH